MRSVIFILLIIAGLLAACSDHSPEQTPIACKNSADAFAREEKFEQLVAEMGRVLGADQVRELQESHKNHKLSRVEMEEAIPEITDDPDYYRLQCEYTDALIEMLELGIEG